MSISAIMATFNADEYLDGAINSFSRQSYADKELIVIDGGSTDRTTEILGTYSSILAGFLSEPDSGIFDAWNKGLALVTGDWVYFMGADDRFFSDRSLHLIAERLDELPREVLIAYAPVALQRSDDEVVGIIGAKWDSQAFRCEGMTIPHQGTFHRRELFQRFGVFDIKLGPTAVYEFLLRYLCTGDAVFLSGPPVAFMGLGGVSTRPENQLQFMKSYRAAQIKHGVLRPSLKRWMYFVQAYIKALMFRLLPVQLAGELVEISRSLAGKKKHYRRTSNP